MPQPMVAGGTIAPARFVKLSTTADHQCLQAGAGDKIAGISQMGTRMTPISGLDDGNAALIGESLQVHQDNERAMLCLGGSVTQGDYLKSDANGKGVTASSTDEAGAQAAESGSSGNVIQVLVRIRKA